VILTELEEAAIQRHATTLGPCPVCQAKAWNVGGVCGLSAVHIRNVRGSSAAEMLPQMFPVAMLTCENCLLVLTFDMQKALKRYEETPDASTEDQ
jgi:hypothetical protein